MALSTIGIVLKWGDNAENVAKVIDIKDFPDLIGEPEMLETTVLASDVQTFIPGVKSLSTLTFTYNYTKEDFAKVEADANKELHYVLEFADGSKFSWTGQHTSGLPGKSVNEVLEATVNIAASSAVTFSAE